MRGAAIGEQVGIDELANFVYALHAAGGVDEGDQAVSLAAAVGGVQAEDGAASRPGATQAVTNVRQFPQAAGGVGLGEETRWVSTLGTSGAGDYRSEVGGEIRISHAAS